MQQPTMDDMVYLGVRGKVIALRRSDGEMLWTTPIKGWSFVNVCLRGPDLFATTLGQIACLDPLNGRVLWINPLRGLGYGIISIATTDNTAAIAAEIERREDQAAATS